MGITQKELQLMFDYDPKTGVFVWRDSYKDTRFHTFKPKGLVTGKRAGTPKKSATVRAGTLRNNSGATTPEESRNYVRIISIERRQIRADKLAVIYMTGIEPNNVFHLDGDRLNDAYDNLEPTEKLPNYKADRKPSKKDLEKIKIAEERAIQERGIDTWSACYANSKGAI